MFNMFSGGALERMSILALGIMPYISASIIMQLMSAVVPQLEQLKNQGMSPLIYAKEVKRLNNLTQSLPASNLYDLNKVNKEIGIEFNALELELYLSKLKQLNQ